MKNMFSKNDNSWPCSQKEMFLSVIIAAILIVVLANI